MKLSRSRQLSWIILFALISSFSFAQEKQPRDVVIEWTRTYAVDMNQAAELTTSELRAGEPKEAWADEKGRILQSIGYKHLGGKVMEERTEGDKALVILQAEIETQVGKTKQREFYFLKKIEGKWLIHLIQIQEEVAEEPEENL